MLELTDEEMDPFPMDGIIVPLIKRTEPEPPTVEVRVDGHGYHYVRSYPIKGHSAVMPDFLREQLAEGKKPLIIERPDRFYVYVAE